jgi:YHS domain-containing protein
MFRVIFWLLGLVIVISLLRGVIGIIFRGLGLMLNPQSNQNQQAGQRPENQVPLTGELKKDPACGTYIAAATSLKETVGGETFYFCSKQCRDKYVASLAR